MVEPFADEAYYEENFGTPPAAIAGRLGKELARASRYLRAECPGIDGRIQLWAIDPSADGAIDPELAADVVCEMVKTAAASAGNGIESSQTGAGPYTETVKYINPSGDLFLTKKQRRLLGYSAQQAFTVSMAPAYRDDPLADLGLVDR